MKAENSTNNQPAFPNGRWTVLPKCKFCGSGVNLDNEGVTYRNGSCAHDHCHNSEEYRRENAADLD